MDDLIATGATAYFIPDARLLLRGHDVGGAPWRLPPLLPAQVTHE